MGIPAISLTNPADLYLSQHRGIALSATYTDSVNSLQALSVLIEIDTVNTFSSANRQFSAYTTVASGRPCVAYFHLQDGEYFWRVTATNTDGTTVSDIRKITVALSLKRTLSAYVNIGKKTPVLTGRSLYAHANIAKYGPAWTNKRVYYNYLNTIIAPPIPYIDRLSLTRTLAGGTITLYGNGFGYDYIVDVNNEDRYKRSYGGLVYIGNKLCNVLEWSWQQITIQLPLDAVSGPIKVVLTAPTVSESNLIGLEIYEGRDYGDLIGLEVFICDKNNPSTILCQLDNAKGKAFQAILNEAGSGSFSISKQDPKASYISDQNFVLFRLDGTDIFKWVIESIKPSIVSSDGQQMIDVSGRGILSVLERGIVYPENMPLPETTSRDFFEICGGCILRTLILEAQARGCFPSIVLDWTPEIDSIGNPFTDKTTISFSAGTPITEVITKLTDGMGLFDLELTTDMHLRLYKRMGNDLSEEVIYRKGQAIITHEEESDTSELVNSLMVGGSGNTLVIADHPTSAIDWGRREGFLSASNVPDEWAELLKYGEMYLETAAIPQKGMTASVAKIKDNNGNILEPFKSYRLGDWIGWQDSEKVRVKGITCSENDSGNLDYTLDLNNILLEKEILMNQYIERLGQYTQKSSLSEPNNTAGTAPKNHSHRHSQLTGLGQDDHPQYLTAERHASNTHSFIQRVTSLKKNGEESITGDVSLVAGNNIQISQDNNLKTITISATGGGGGGGGASRQWFNLWSYNPPKTTSAHKAKGVYLAPNVNVILHAISAVVDDNNRNMRLVIYEVNAAYVQQGAAIAESTSITLNGKNNYIYRFPSSIVLEAGKYYILAGVLESGTALGMCDSKYVIDTMITGLRGYATINDPSPEATWTVTLSNETYALGMLIDI